MPLGYNQLFTSEDTHLIENDLVSPLQRVIRSALPVDLDSVIATDRPNVVFADEVIVNGEVNIQLSSKMASQVTGPVLRICCRVIRFEAGGSIVTSGLPANSMPEGAKREPAAGYRKNGKDGKNGADGSDGLPGGQGGAVAILAHTIVGSPVIKASGGAGGRGLGGGDGARGKTGDDGKMEYGHAPDDPKDAPVPPTCNGQPGHNGGDAGLPGFSGWGGAGGDISLAYVSAGQLNPTLVETKAGGNGPAALVGKPGKRGYGGKPGYAHIESWTPTAFKPVTKPGHPGHSGDDGNPRLEEAEQRKNPDPAKPQPVDGTITIAQLTPADYFGQFAAAATGLDHPDDTFLDLFTCAVEDNYRRQGNTPDITLLQQIEFLQEICAAVVAPGTTRGELLLRVCGMRQRLALGLDFYGYSVDSAPLLSFESYEQKLNMEFLPHAKLIQNGFLDICGKAQLNQKERTQIEDARGAAQENMTSLGDEINNAVELAGKLSKELPGLFKDVERSESALQGYEHALTAAIAAKNKNGECSLSRVIDSVSTIVASVASGIPTGMAVVKSAKTFIADFAAKDDSLRQLWENRALLKDDLKVIGAQAGDVAGSIAAIRGAVDSLSPAQRKTPQFVMERARFDEVAKEFADLLEGQAYREAGYNYLDCVDARNKAVIDYNSILNRIIELWAVRDGSLRAIRGLDNVLNGLNNPAQPLIVSLMSRFYLDVLGLAARAVHAEKKALAYLLARPAQAPVSALFVESIVAAHDQVSADWLGAKEQFAAQQELAPQLLRLDLRELVTEQAWCAFLDSRRLSFSIRRDHPDYNPILEGLPGLRVTGLALSLEGATAKPKQTQASWIIKHGGYEIIYKSNGEAVRFQHKPITLHGFTGLAGEGGLLMSDFSEKGLYAGVSPYASWRLELSDNPLLGLDLRQLTKATLVLDGYIVAV